MTPVPLDKYPVAVGTALWTMLFSKLDNFFGPVLATDCTATTYAINGCNSP